MCGALKYNGQTYKLGNRLTACEYRTKQLVQGNWSGFIREERLDWWEQQTTLKPVEIRADGFLEGKYEIDVPSRSILGYQLMGDVQYKGKTIGRKGEIKILTRAPITMFEKHLHPRWPIVKIGVNRKLFAFQSWDIKGKVPAKQMEMPFDSAAEE